MQHVTAISADGAAWDDWRDDAPIPAFSAGLQFGVCVFEGMQALLDDAGRARILFLPDHHARLQRSAATLGLSAPDQQTFDRGLMRAVVQALSRGVVDPEKQRIYLRTILYSGAEEIFPSSTPPYLCSIFALLVARPLAPSPLHFLAGPEFVRALPHSHLGAAKSAINYTRIVELDRSGVLAPDQQRIWLSPGHPALVEELDTMSLGLVMEDGTFHSPPDTGSKLASVTMGRLRRALRAKGTPIASVEMTLETLVEGIESGRIAGLFGASTGKGLGYATTLEVGGRSLPLRFPEQTAQRLWRLYTAMMQDDALVA
jgi:branched-chain amino acid aminotransferase